MASFSRRQIPPFAAVRAFEAAARDGNLRTAAEQLSLTPSAVSHQIRALEQYLGRALFARGPKGLTLTAAGQDYCAEVSAALDQLERATRRVMVSESGKTIRLCCYMSLTQSWFLPRLASLHETLPDIDLQIISQIEPLEVDPSEVELMLTCLDTAPAGRQVDHLVDEEIFPVCGPDFLRRTRLETPADLAGVTLLCCYGNEADWPHWALCAGLPPSSLPSRLVRFETQALLQEAAAAGLGVALARTPFVNADLESGKLVAPFAEVHASGLAYCLVGDPHIAEQPNVAALRRWIVQGFRETNRIQSRTNLIRLNIRSIR